MKNKKKLLLLITSVVLSTLTLGVVGLNSFSSFPSIATELPSSLDCEYYFNPANKYTSIYDLNDQLFSDTYSGYENTWGTITGYYRNSNKDCYYMQSTDQNGKSAALVLYNVSETLEVGNVVTVSGGSYQQYNNNHLPQIQQPDSIHVDYETNPSPVEELLTGSTFWDTDNMTPEDIEALFRKGPIRATISNMNIGVVGNSYTYCSFLDSSDVKVNCYYQGSTQQNNVKNKLIEIKNQNKTATITGYVNYYNGTTLELLVRDPKDVVAYTSEVTSIDVTQVGDIYYQDMASPLSFNVTAHYADGSSRVVTSGVELLSFSTDKPGLTTANLKYEEDGKTVYGSCQVNVIDNETSISVDSGSIDHYYPNETFINPTVYAHNYYQAIDVTNVATISNAGTSTTGVHECDIEYENTKGDTLEMTFYYWVSDVYQLTVSGFSTSYDVGDPMSSYEVIAEYMNGDEADVTNRSSLTVTGFHTANPGTRYVTFSYGEESINVQYTVYGEIELEYIDLVGAVQTNYNLGDSFVKPTVYAYYNDDTYSDISNEVTFSGFDTSTTGNKTVHVYYGDFEITYNITVTYQEVSSLTVNSYQEIYEIGDSFTVPTITANYVSGGSSSVGGSCSYTGFDSSEIGRKTITASYGGKSVTFNIRVVTDYSGSYKVLTKSDFSDQSFTKYSSGNYASANGFEGYRVKGPNNNYSTIMTLLPYPSNSNYAIDPVEGYLSNDDPYYDIDKIFIEYKTTNSSGSLSPSISYGQHDSISYSTSLPYTSSSSTSRQVVIDLNDKTINYFRINSGSTTVYIEDVQIEYSGTYNDATFTSGTSMSNDYRIEPTVYTGVKTAGTTQVTVPVDVTKVGNSYTVNQSKTYTYYTYEYVANNSYPSVIEDASMIDPVDIANYYTIFGELPVNYCSKSDYSSYYSLFGNKTRIISSYSRTDGYALAVPWREYSQGKPLYYEFDIAQDSSYSSSNRGVARLVVWVAGLTSYGNYPTCHYTDDHYASFKEFNNCGGFMTRFNAERFVRFETWSTPITLS